jgi:hypothetical protein
MTTTDTIGNAKDALTNLIQPFPNIDAFQIAPYVSLQKNT